MHPIRVAVLGRSSEFGVRWSVVDRTKRFGREVAKRGYPLVTGGGNGLPHTAERAASENGGETWAVSPASSAETRESDLRTTTVLFPTGTGGGAGTIEREAPLVEIANVRALFHGGPGTFGELIAGMHEPGVIALLEDTGGVSSAARERILPYVGLPETVRVVHSEDPAQLLNRAEEALGGLRSAGVNVTPTRLFRPARHESVISRERAREHNVFSFLVEDNGQSNATDRAATVRLIDLALASRIDGRKPIAVAGAAQRRLTTEVLVRATRDHDVEAIGISTEDGPDQRWKPNDSERTFLVKRTGNGPGVGEFAAHREIVDQADAIFVSSAYFKNLAGLAFALRDEGKPIIAVLEQESTGSSHLRDMLNAINDGPLSDRFVFSSDPAELMAKVERRLVARRAPPPPPPARESWFSRTPWPWERTTPSDGSTRIPVSSGGASERRNTGPTRATSSDRPAYERHRFFGVDRASLSKRQQKKYDKWYWSPEGPGGAPRRPAPQGGGSSETHRRSSLLDLD